MIFQNFKTTIANRGEVTTVEQILSASNNYQRYMAVQYNILVRS